MTGILDAVAHAATFHVGQRVSVRLPDRGRIVAIETVAEVRALSGQVVLGDGAVFDATEPNRARYAGPLCRAYPTVMEIRHATADDDTELARDQDLALIRSTLADPVFFTAREPDGSSIRYLTAQEARAVRVALEHAASVMHYARGERQSGGVRRAGSCTVGYYDRVTGEYHCASHKPTAARHLVNEIHSDSRRAHGKACVVCGVELKEREAKK